MTVTENQIKLLDVDIYAALGAGLNLRQVRRKLHREWAKKGISNFDDVYKDWKKMAEKG